MPKFNTSFLKVFALLFLAFLTLTTVAQTARKPSYYDESRQRLLVPSSGHAPQTPIQSSENWKNQLANQEEFNKFSRVYYQGTPYEIPHLIFAIDIKNNRIYYINTPKFLLHEKFIAALTQQNLSLAEFNKNYFEPDRRYILGTLSWQGNQQQYTYEFWEGDRITPKLLTLTQQKLATSFFTSITFKTNSTWHEEVALEADLPFITQEALIQDQPFLALNMGKAVGYLRVIEREEDLDHVGEHDIILLTEVPLSLPPVAGVITEKPSTALSHVNLLAKGWGIPNIYLKDARVILASLINQPITLDVSFNNYTINGVTDPQALNFATPNKQELQNLPTPNLTQMQLKPLGDLKAADSLYCGAKAANLGEVKAYISGVTIPDGFCIPFAHYAQFIKNHAIDEKLKQLEAQPEFLTNTRFRREALAALRAQIVELPVDPAFSKIWIEQWQNQLGSRGVFVRSSSNSEDLPHFSGAGLYTTIPNVTTAQGLEEAVKRSWASIYNFEAYEARRVARIGQNSVVMAVFVQIAVNADASGVLVTKDPFDPTRLYASYIVAKKGLGIRVVEGRKLAEQVIYSHQSQAIQILSRSDEMTALVLDNAGGVKEVAIELNRAVLNDDLVKRLAFMGERIKLLFKGVDQDIEWAVHNDEIIILQVRPFIQR